MRRFRAAGRALIVLLSVLAVPGTSAAGDMKAWSGGPTPALALKDLAAREHRLEDYRGKVVVISFWATWCEPCRDEMPSLNRLKAAMGDAIAVLAVDMGEPEARIATFLEKVPVDFPVLLDRDMTVSKAWKVKVLPTTIVVDPQGAARYVTIGGRDWASPDVQERLRRLLSSP